MTNTPKGRRKCCFPDCDRDRASKEGYCGSHVRQWKKYGEVWAFGDTTRTRAHRAAAWERLPDEVKARRIAKLVAFTKGKPRSAEHSRRISESNRARWQQGGPDLSRRICRGCEGEFQPNSGNHFYCDADCQNARKRLRRHGLTNRQYLDLLEAQGGVCPLCGSSGRGFGGSKYALVVDHCHDTGQVRGLLCPDCNTALGRFGDDAARLRAAADYIERTCPH